MSAISRLPAPRITAIGSGKGGTGKTLIAIVLAQVLAARGERVLLCDADFGLSNTTVHLGSNYGGDLAGVLRGEQKLANAVVAVRRDAQAQGFDILAAPAGSGALANATLEQATRLVSVLQCAGRYHRVLLDLSAGVGAVTMLLAAAADETLLTLTPDAAALTDAYAFTKLLLRKTGRVPEFLINMAPTEAEGRRTADAFRRTCKSFLKLEPNCVGHVPQDVHVAAWVRRQEVLASRTSESPALRVMQEIAGVLAARMPCAAGAAVGLR